MAIGTFDGYTIKIICGDTGRVARFEFFYGGLSNPDGPGHGHVISNDGNNIHYWRTPESEGGAIIIDTFISFENLVSHGIGFS